PLVGRRASRRRTLRYPSPWARGSHLLGWGHRWAQRPQWYSDSDYTNGNPACTAVGSLHAAVLPHRGPLHSCSTSLGSYRLGTGAVGVFWTPGRWGSQQAFQAGPRNLPVVMKPVWATIRWSGR